MNPELQAAIDERLQAALTNANYRVTLNTQKQNARLRYQKALTYALNGGIFMITPELISFVQALVSMGKKNAILLDYNQNPVEIADVVDFMEVIVDKYYQCSNDYLVEFRTIQKSRTTKALVGE